MAKLSAPLAPGKPSGGDDLKNQGGKSCETGVFFWDGGVWGWDTPLEDFLQRV